MHPCLSLLSVLAGFGGAAIIIWTRSPFFLHNRTRNVKEKLKRKVKTFRPLHSPVHTAIKPNQILSDQVGRKLPSFEHKRRGEQDMGHSIFFPSFSFLKCQKNLILFLGYIQTYSAINNPEEYLQIDQPGKQTKVVGSSSREGEFHFRENGPSLPWPLCCPAAVDRLTTTHTCLKSKR